MCAGPWLRRAAGEITGRGNHREYSDIGGEGEGEESTGIYFEGADKAGQHDPACRPPCTASVDAARWKGRQLRPLPLPPPSPSLPPSSATAVARAPGGPSQRETAALPRRRHGILSPFPPLILTIPVSYRLAYLCPLPLPPPQRTSYR